MIRVQRSDISYLLNEIAQSLDISDSLFEDAEKKYRAVGSWLGEGNSPLAVYSPEIYPQGSFLLGTVTKPLSDKDEFDIDVVFKLAVSKGKISQKDFKQLVGDRLKANEIYQRMLDEEGRRCWTLHYADSAQFHLDILPAIPDGDFSILLKSQGVPFYWADTSIDVTDKTMPNYDRISSDWFRCNPKGFAAWFHNRMLIQYDELRKRLLMEAVKAQIEKVPVYRIKTPLQRCIQLLKRHRDIVFENDPDNRPASIIITTLAANAYDNEADIVDAMIKMIDKMPSFITNRNGVSWVVNPVNPSENFAERWKDHPDREPNFRKWLREVKADFIKVLTCNDTDTAGKVMVPIFGEWVSRSVITKFEESTTAKGISDVTVIQKAPPVVTITSPNKPWGF